VAKGKYRYRRDGNVYCGIHANKLERDFNDTRLDDNQVCEAVKANGEPCTSIAIKAFMGKIYCGTHHRQQEKNYERMLELQQHFSSMNVGSSVVPVGRAISDRTAASSDIPSTSGSVAPVASAQRQDSEESSY